MGDFLVQVTVGSTVKFLVMIGSKPQNVGFALIWAIIGAHQ